MGHPETAAAAPAGADGMDTEVDVRFRNLFTSGKIPVISAHEIKFVKRLGAGSFGIVEECLIPEDELEPQWLLAPPGSTTIRTPALQTQRSGLSASSRKSISRAQMTAVAVKRFRQPVMQDLAMCGLVCNEVDILFACQHPSIVGAYGIGCVHGGPENIREAMQSFFLVMEYIKGLHVRKLVTQAMCRTNELVYRRQDALRWLKELAQALAHLHSRHPKIMHRDVKLDNIILTTEDPETADIRLLDLGLAVRLPGYAIQEAASVHPVARRSALERAWSRSLNESVRGGNMSGLKSSLTGLMHRSSPSHSNHGGVVQHGHTSGGLAGHGHEGQHHGHGKISHAVSKLDHTELGRVPEGRTVTPDTSFTAPQRAATTRPYRTSADLTTIPNSAVTAIDNNTIGQSNGQPNGLTNGQLTTIPRKSRSTNILSSLAAVITNSNSNLNASPRHPELSVQSPFSSPSQQQQRVPLLSESGVGGGRDGGRGVVSGDGHVRSESAHGGTAGLSISKPRGAQAGSTTTLLPRHGSASPTRMSAMGAGTGQIPNGSLKGGAGYLNSDLNLNTKTNSGGSAGDVPVLPMPPGATVADPSQASAQHAAAAAATADGSQRAARGASYAAHCLQDPESCAALNDDRSVSKTTRLKSRMQFVTLDNQPPTTTYDALAQTVCSDNAPTNPQTNNPLAGWDAHSETHHSDQGLYARLMTTGTSVPDTVTLANGQEGTADSHARSVRYQAGGAAAGGSAQGAGSADGSARGGGAFGGSPRLGRSRTAGVVGGVGGGEGSVRRGMSESGGQEGSIRNRISSAFGFGGRQQAAAEPSKAPVNDNQAYNLTRGAGSLCYMAPEVFQGLPYNEKADVFSFAICMYELLHFTHILVSILNSASLHGKNKDASIKEYAAAVAAGYRPPIDERLPKPIQTLIQQCWAANPLERPTMAQVEQALQNAMDTETEELDQLDRSRLVCGCCTVM